MGLSDVVIIAVIAVLLALAIRSIVRSGSGGACAGCGSQGTCAAHAAGGTCKAADDMLARAERALSKK